MTKPPVHRAIPYEVQVEILRLWRDDMTVEDISLTVKQHSYVVEQIVAHGLPDTTPVTRKKSYQRNYMAKDNLVIKRAPCGHLINTHFCISCEVERIAKEGK